MIRRAIIIGLLSGGTAYAQGNNNFQSLPSTNDMGALQATMNTNARNSDEYGGQQIRLYPGMITPGTGASITVGGNTFTLLFGSPDTFPNDWTGQVAINGSIMHGGDYTAAMTLLDGQLYIEDSKGHGWLVYDQSSGSFVSTPDPGTGGSGANTSAATSATASPPQAAAFPASQATAAPGQACAIAPNAITPSNGSFTDGASNAYSIDAANGDVASINGAPVNGGAYRTSQLLVGSDGNVYGQDENTAQWSELVNGGATWQPLTGLPTDGQSPTPTTRWDTAQAGGAAPCGNQPNTGAITQPRPVDPGNPATQISSAMSAPDLARIQAELAAVSAQIGQLSPQAGAATTPQPQPQESGGGGQ